jgi:hypothetical protein
MKKMLLLVTLLALVSIVSVAIAIQRPASDPASAATAIQKPAPDPASAAPVFTEPVKPLTEKIKKFSGLIEKVDKIGKAIVVRSKMMKEEKLLTFIINDKTKITKGKTTATLGDLKKDVQVFIEYKKEMNKMIAVTIEVSAPNDAPNKI